MKSDVDFNISQLRIILKILRNKLGAQIFEPKYMMKTLSGDMIIMKLELNLNLF